MRLKSAERLSIPALEGQGEVTCAQLFSPKLPAIVNVFVYDS
jgi:hypothetical protein